MLWGEGTWRAYRACALRCRARAKLTAPCTLNMLAAAMGGMDTAQFKRSQFKRGKKMSGVRNPVLNWAQVRNPVLLTRC